MPQQEFLFVNPSNRSKGGHKISATGRAFVIQKARTSNPWSTKSKKLTLDRLDGDHGSLVSSLQQSFTAYAGDETGRRDAAAQVPSYAIRAREQTVPNLSMILGELPAKTSGSNRHECRRPSKCPQCRIPLKCGPCLCVVTSKRAAVCGPSRQLGSGLDPFQNHTATTSFPPRITLCTNDIQNALEVQDYWITASSSHAGFLHSILCLAALKLSLIHQHQSEAMADRFMHHRLQAMAAIQRALSHNDDLNNKHTALSDESIATVFNLVCTEEILALHASRTNPTHMTNKPARLLLQPDPAQRRAHLAGWNRMLALRGGVTRLQSGLQSFVMRWAYVALSCMLMSLYNQPHMYRLPPSSSSSSSSFATTRFLPACRSLPRRGLETTYNYPSASPFLHLGSRMASACRREGMHHELATKILTAECLLQDGRAWLRSGGAAYKWTAHDMQNIFSLALGELVRWNFEHEALISGAENLVAMGLFIFLFLAGTASEEGEGEGYVEGCWGGYVGCVVVDDGGEGVCGFFGGY
ncbi:hypothetical protein B0T19DRAFT_483046 [Cercophora scortea]|uniref:Uncharacterized protein n=1 Tax=Cercophora scortea TaxID=314031 RepID=A0AAE0MIH1_9PEZI|nr:hypothetical protein B0T19DRAFT_483046 [Cercophora scortea]